MKLQVYTRELAVVLMPVSWQYYEVSSCCYGRHREVE